MTLGESAGMAVDLYLKEVVALVGLVPVVAHEDNDRPPAQIKGFQLPHDPPDRIVGRGHKGGVSAQGLVQFLEKLQVLLEWLLGVMRGIESQVEKEGPVLVAVEELNGPFFDQFREIPSLGPDLTRSLV